MGNPAGRKRDFEALEERRFEAVRLLENSDLNQSEVALTRLASDSERRVQSRRQGCAPGSRTSGQKTGTDLADRKGPKELGYETPLWTGGRVAWPT
jgi:hypothetical protein